MKKCVALFSVLMFIFCSCSLIMPSENQNENGTQDSSEPDTEAESETEALIPLLAADENEALYLYGIKPVGAVLYSNGEGHYYDWDLIGGEVCIYGGLFDYDSNEDIAIVSDIDENMQEMRIISDGDFSPENVYTVAPDEFNSYIKNSVSHSFNEETKSVIFTINGKNFIFDLSESFRAMTYSGISYSKNVKYSVKEGKLYVTLSPVVIGETDNGITEKSISELTITSHLRFDGTHIALEDTVVDGLLQTY